jgi:hypothetical protein
MPAHLSTQRVQAELAETGRAWKVTDMASGGERACARGSDDQKKSKRLETRDDCLRASSEMSLFEPREPAIARCLRVLKGFFHRYLGFGC